MKLISIYQPNIYHILLQNVVNIRIKILYFTFSFVLSLQNLVYISHLAHVSIQTTHISSVNSHIWLGATLSGQGSSGHKSIFISSPAFKPLEL